MRGAGTANRALAVLSSLMQHAEALGLRPDHSNPCRGLRRRKSGFEARYLTDGEFAALGRALDVWDKTRLWPPRHCGSRGHANRKRFGCGGSTCTMTGWCYRVPRLAPGRSGSRLRHAPSSPASRAETTPRVFATNTGDPVRVAAAWYAIRPASGLGRRANPRSTALPCCCRGQRRHRSPDRFRVARPRRHQDDVRVCPPCRGAGVRRSGSGVVPPCNHARAREEWQCLSGPA